MAKNSNACMRANAVQFPVDFQQLCAAKSVPTVQKWQRLNSLASNDNVALHTLHPLGGSLRCSLQPPCSRPPPA